MDAFLAEHGRQLVGWDEILEGGLADGAVVMSWRGEEGGIVAAKAGHDVVMAPSTHTYLDYHQGPRRPSSSPSAALLPLETVYSFEPFPAGLTADQARHILGGQGQLWGEHIADPATASTWPLPAPPPWPRRSWSAPAGPQL